MTLKPVWKTAELYGRDGHLAATVRVPATEKAPGVIQWGTRHFARAVDDMRYVETAFYFVPLENMYVKTAPPREEYEKGSKG